MSEGAQKYIVFWTWDFADTEKGIELYEKMDALKARDMQQYPNDEKELYLRKYPTSHGSSGGGHGSSPDWFTIFEATDEQLKNWLEHYGDVLKVKKIMPIMMADEFVKKWKNEEITWKYWYGI